MEYFKTSTNDNFLNCRISQTKAKTALVSVWKN